MKKKLLLFLSTISMLGLFTLSLSVHPSSYIKEAKAETAESWDVYINDEIYDKKTIYYTGSDPITINHINLNIDSNVYNITDKTNLDLTFNGENFNFLLVSNGSGLFSFTPNLSGTYSIKVKYLVEATSTTYTTNLSFKTTAKEGAPTFEPFSFSANALHNQKYYFPDAISNDGSITSRGLYCVNNATYYSASFDSSNNKYYFDFSTASFTDANLIDNIGKFYAVITATNSVSNTTVGQFITTKYELRDEEARKATNFFNSANWYNASPLSTSVTLNSPSFYKGAFKINDGIKIPINLSGLTSGGWVVMCVGQMPIDNRCASWGASTTNTGFYFRFYGKSSGEVYVDIQYGDKYGGVTGLKGDYYLGVLDSNYVELQMSPFDLETYPDKFDQFEIKFNKVLFEGLGLDGCVISDMADDEGYVYLSSYNYGGGVINLSKTIASVDRGKPVVSLNEDIIVQGYMGDLVSLPTARAVDEVDGDIEASLLNVIGPNQKTITVINNRFMMSLEGEYQVTYSATDSCGNVGYASYTIKSLNPNPYTPKEDDFDIDALYEINNTPLIIVGVISAIVFIGLLSGLIIIINKRY